MKIHIIVAGIVALAVAPAAAQTADVSILASTCSGCHGAGGEGAGAAYGFVNGSVMKTFPHIEDQLRWVVFGTQKYAVHVQLDPRALGNAQPGTLAFRLLEADWTLKVGIEALEPYVTVQALQEVTMREGQTLTRLALRARQDAHRGVERAAERDTLMRDGFGRGVNGHARGAGCDTGPFPKVRRTISEPTAPRL